MATAEPTLFERRKVHGHITVYLARDFGGWRVTALLASPGRSVTTVIFDYTWPARVPAERVFNGFVGAE